MLNELFPGQSLESLNSTQLLSVYNACAQKLSQTLVQRFSDRKTALRRTEKMVLSYGEHVAYLESQGLKANKDYAAKLAAESAANAEHAAKLEAATEKFLAEKDADLASQREAAAKFEATPTLPKPQRRKPTKGGGKARGMVFVFPASAVIKAVRPGTHRATLVELLRKGATFEQCLAATWANDAAMAPEVQRKNTYEAIRLLHYYVGYGMTQDAAGVIRLVG